MDKQLAQCALEFLERTEVKATEVNVFNDVVNTLNKQAEKPESKMDRKMAQCALEFLNRIKMKATEVDVFIRVVLTLQAAANPQTNPTSKGPAPTSKKTSPKKRKTGTKKSGKKR